MALVRTTLLAGAFAGTMLTSFLTSAAWAQPVDGLYVGAGAGYNFLQDVTATVDALPGRSVGNGVSASAPMRVRWGDGFLVSGSVGWGFGNGLRLEVEGSYRDNAQSGSNGGGNGHERRTGIMGNALYDFDLGLDWVTPYAGVGVGYQMVSLDHVTGAANNIDTGSPTFLDIDQSRGAFAYQFIVGAAFPIESVPGLAVTAEYRYMNTAGSRGYRAVGSTPGVSGAFPNNTTRARFGEDGSHSIVVGLRYAFDMPDSAPVDRPPPAPEPAQAPVPAPAEASVPARTYLVFFDWDSAELTPRARDIIADAVRNSASVPHTRIEVTGHADRSGTPRGNMVLSRRRAEVVASELERRGVPSETIDIHAAGDTQPIVPTAPGVRQSENRRVEIVYR